MQKKIVSIIIVNYNTAKEIIDLLNSIYSYLARDYFEIIIVDNNSTDREINKLNVLFPEAKLVLLEDNIGFGKANNLAAEIAEGKYLLILNPDTLLTENFVTPIITLFEQNAEIGICAPVLLNEDRSIQNSTGIKLGIIYETSEALMLINYLRKIYRRWFLKKISAGKPFKVSWVSASCMVIPKKLFGYCGGFKKEFFLNYEDIDLCERVKSYNYSVFCFPEKVCIHLDHRSQSKNYESFVYNRYQSRLIYSKIHYKYPKRVLIYLIHIVGLVLRLFLTGIFYSGKEKSMRLSGYKKSLKLYLNGIQ